MDEKKIKTLITVGSVIFVIIVGTFILYSNRDKSATEKTIKNKNEKLESTFDKYTGIIIELDINNNELKVRDFKNTEELELKYTQGCEIKNIYGKDIYFNKLKIGDIVVVGYDKDFSDLRYIALDESILQYKELKKYTLDENLRYIKLEEKKYRLTEETFIYAKTNKNKLSINDLDENDILSLNIQGKDIISIVVEKGHGYIELANYDAFLGYSITVNDDVSYEIKENLRIPVPEGKNEFTIKNDRLTGSVSVYNFANVDKIIDIKQNTFEEKKEGKVKFYIEPKNARLYINGKSYYYDDDIVLDYGKYRFNVESSGYDSYAGIMDINSDERTISVYLKEKLKSIEPTKNSDNLKDTEDSDKDTEEKDNENDEAKSTEGASKEPNS